MAGTDITNAFRQLPIRVEERYVLLGFLDLTKIVLYSILWIAVCLWVYLPRVSPVKDLLLPFNRE